MINNRGVTLISVIIYVIAILIIMGVVAVISNYFYKNVADSMNDIDPVIEYTKFTSFFSEEVNTRNIKVLEWNENYIVFDNGIQYKYIAQNKGIYRNKVKICRNVDEFSFNVKNEDGKDKIEVYYKSGNFDNSNIEFTLKK